MANYFDDNEDLRWYVDSGIDWEPLVRRTEYDFRAADGFPDTAEAVEFYREVLQLVGNFSADEIGAHIRDLEVAPELVDGEVVYPAPLQAIWDGLDALEIHGLCLPRELGGLNAPVLLLHLQNELLARADVSISAHHGFHGGMAMAALAYSVTEGTTTFDPEGPHITETRFRRAIDSIVGNSAFGSMDITEPHAGSDMAQLRCKGEVDDAGNWFVTGNKVFITSGHGRWHFVIARTEPTVDADDAFAGLKGLSMFLVEAYDVATDGSILRTHTTVDSLEHKLGHTASATVSVSFDRAPAELIGQRGEGFRHMLLLMNNARVGVGFEALGLCEAACRMAQSYAADRVSMGKTIDQHELIADMLDEMRTDCQAIRALAVRAGWLEELTRKIGIELQFMPPADPARRIALERHQRQLTRRARRLTPLVKYLASEKAVEMARRNMQIHGGAGYMCEIGAEKLLRDAMVMPVYEGTSQIQALMAMKDTLLAAVRHPRSFLRDAAHARWRARTARDANERRVAKLQTLHHQAVQFLLSRLAGHKLRGLRAQPMAHWADALKDFDPKRDFALAMLHSERLIRIGVDVAVAEELLAQASQHPERTELLERWLERAEPRSRYLLDEITTTGLRLLRTLRGHERTAAAAAK